MMPGASSLVVYSICCTDLGVYIDAFDLDEPRLAVAENTVPAIERSRLAVSEPST